MRNKDITRQYYLSLGFKPVGSADYEGYLMMVRDGVELHFFEHKTLNPLENDGQVYIRTTEIAALYGALKSAGVAIHPNGALATKPWGQSEFSLLDPDNNLLTFGAAVD